MVLTKSRAGVGPEPLIEGQLPEDAEYVEAFELDHLMQLSQDLQEAARYRALQPNAILAHPPPPPSQSTTMHLGGGNPSQAMNGGGHILPDQVPPSGPIQQRNGTHSGMSGYPNGSNLSKPLPHIKMSSPSTPPATPPEDSPSYCQLPSSPYPPHGSASGAQTPHVPMVDPLGQRHHNLVNEEMPMWHPHGGPHPQHNRYAEQPIDLTGQCAEGMESGWFVRKYEPHQGHDYIIPHHQMGNQGLIPGLRREGESRDSFDTRDSDNYCPQPGGRSGDLSDDQLIQLPVRELNKKLHGLPRDTVVKLKQKRRTLKNRGYAQNCRTKRLQQRNQLEDKNKILLKELAKLVQERDMWKNRFELLRRSYHQQNNNNNNQINANTQNGLVHPSINGGGNPSNHPNGPIHPNNNHNQCNGNNNPSASNVSGVIEKSHLHPSQQSFPSATRTSSPRSPGTLY